MYDIILVVMILGSLLPIVTSMTICTLALLRFLAMLFFSIVVVAIHSIGLPRIVAGNVATCASCAGRFVGMVVVVIM